MDTRPVAVAAALLLLLANACGIARADGPDVAWELESPILPPLPAGIDANGIGCVALAMAVLEDGRTAHPMVLQGAFNGRVDETARKRFSEAAVEAAKGWRHRHVGPGRRTTDFVTHVVGFGAGVEDRVVLGIDAQAAPLRDACRVDDLHAWTQRNAIPVEKAVALHDGKVALHDDDAVPLWLGVTREPPRYPAAALSAGYSACVVVGFVVGSDGHPGLFKVIRSRLSGPGSRSMREAFENASLVAATEWTHVPSPVNLQRLPEFQQVPVDFAIGGGSAPPCESLSTEELERRMPGDSGEPEAASRL
ncbi:energy transducer TonB [Novilysobacter arseniciresistens]|uniref:energy transducer TonB n=1 Tax=Novilysobacter arseniciresistens TaxID=1385522 RepID=UPI0009DF6477|nr:energy transducer TonB [Lysobacter arseniciresistens]